MIDEKKLIEDLNKINAQYYQSYQVTRIMECINNQPQVQQIVRIPEEIAKLLSKKIGCTACENINGRCDQDRCGDKIWLDWLTKKEVL